jgi:predicted metal-binding protein
MFPADELAMLVMHLKHIQTKQIAASAALENLCSQLARGYGMAATESCSPNVGGS